jgi:hypothetical protein
MIEKRQAYRNKKILQSAKGEDCQARFPGCLNERATTVFCHLNELWAGKGYGMKADDCAGFYGCHHCHDIYDGRKRSHIFNKDKDFYVLKAYYRTIRRLLDKGVIK